MSRFSDHYKQLHDEALIELSLRGGLVPEADRALRDELRSRGVLGSDIEARTVNAEKKPEHQRFAPRINVRKVCNLILDATTSLYSMIRKIDSQKSFALYPRHIFAFIFLLPAFSIAAVVAYVVSSPGFTNWGALTGNSYSVLCLLAIAATLKAIFRTRPKESAPTERAIVTAVVLAILAWLVIAVGGAIWFFVETFSSFPGVCNPRC